MDPFVVMDTSGFVTDDIVRPLAARIPGSRLVSTDDHPREVASFLGGKPRAFFSQRSVTRGGLPRAVQSCVGGEGSGASVHFAVFDVFLSLGRISYLYHMEQTRS